MSHHLQSQLFPENFLYVVALEQTHTLKKELEVYHQPTRGFRNFAKDGFWTQKPKKKIFSQNDRKYSIKIKIVFFE